jgi:hypothetical protein
MSVAGPLNGQLWGVTTHFNPAGFGVKLRNLELFAKRVREQGLKLLIVELAFERNPFQVPRECADRVLQVRSNSVLWQKERMLNIALDQLPEECEKVAWLDGDILFTNDSWVGEASRLLEEYRVVQLYQSAAWLPRGVIDTCLDCAKNDSVLHQKLGVAFAKRCFQGNSGVILRPELVHPGFAWAARRSILRSHSLYDKCIVGGGDFYTMLGMYRDSKALAEPNVGRYLCRKQLIDLAAWTDKFHSDVASDVAFTPGSVLHLWHGSLLNRSYVERCEILREFDFDPATDITLNDEGCWEWSSDKPELHRRVREYFASRKEDD